MKYIYTTVVRGNNIHNVYESGIILSGIRVGKEEHWSKISPWGKHRLVYSFPLPGRRKALIYNFPLGKKQTVFPRVCFPPHQFRFSPLGGRSRNEGRRNILKGKI